MDEKWSCWVTDFPFTRIIWIRYCNRSLELDEIHFVFGLHLGPVWRNFWEVKRSFWDKSGFWILLANFMKLLLVRIGSRGSWSILLCLFQKRKLFLKLVSKKKLRWLHQEILLQEGKLKVKPMSNRSSVFFQIWRCILCVYHVDNWNGSSDSWVYSWSVLILINLLLNWVSNIVIISSEMCLIPYCLLVNSICQLFLHFYWRIFFIWSLRDEIWPCSDHIIASNRNN